MTDYRRMVWQSRANRIAEAIRVICWGACIPLVILVFAQPSFGHSMLMLGNGFIIVGTLFVDHYTKQYRGFD